MPAFAKYVPESIGVKIHDIINRKNQYGCKVD